MVRMFMYRWLPYILFTDQEEDVAPVTRRASQLWMARLTMKEK
jgi:hypothetical protein